MPPEPEESRQKSLRSAQVLQAPYGHTPELDDSRRLALKDAGRWFALGVGSAAVAVCFALYLAIARIPGLETTLSPDPEFGHRGLVVHVNLSLGVVFSSCIAGLFCLLPGTRRTRITPLAQLGALAGVLIMMVSIFFRDAEPLKSNYVPTLNHPVFVVGVSVFACAVGAGFLDRRMLPAREDAILPPDARPALRLAGVAYLLMIVTVLGAWQTQADTLTPLQYYDRLFWGGGHVQQFANVLAMAGAWLFLLSRVLRKLVIDARLAAGLFAVLLAPTLAGPWLTFGDKPPQEFTQMMRWGIFPMVSVLLLICIARLWSARTALAPGALRGPAFAGFVTSAAMTVAGFVMGSLIRDNTTLVPAHYHMSLGGVTVAFMAAILELLPDLGVPAPSARTRRWTAVQPVLYGGGMALMAIGFGFAGSVRKTYGTEQVVRGTAEWAGLVTMGIGGVISTIGGVAFLVILFVALRAARRRKSQTSL
ncbi:MAG: hypothetical protein H6839_01165 [Planctomycetes bacterium]|nr:hypothetical protein [Planctomycetota bacterium]